MILDNVEINLVLPKRVHHINMLLNHFSSRWRNEYVAPLREYDKNTKKTTKTNEIKPSISNIVIALEEKQP